VIHDRRRGSSKTRRSVVVCSATDGAREGEWTTSWCSMPCMAVPDWATSRAGTRIRVALWLQAEVGVGGVFTKAQLRDAFPNVEQIDRRMRDLRPEGWIITTYREDRSLAVDELRLVHQGGSVWERGYVSKQSTAVTATERRAIFASDNYACVYCGITGGETYPEESLRTAKLGVARSVAVGSGQTQLVTICDRCHAAGPGELPSIDAMVAAIERLEPDQQRVLRTWVSQGSKPQTQTESLWGQYRRLPRDGRLVIRAHLEGPRERR
jgi:hypothetical protein